MGKKALILMGSPRRGGNSDHLSDEFIRGAREAGFDTEKIHLMDRKIGGCLGCFTCQRNGGLCVQHDDMSELYEKIKDADVIVFASPVYFYTWTAQMKTFIDRTVALESGLKNKTFYLLSTGQAPNEQYMITMIDSFRKYIGCFRADSNREGGYLFGYGTDKPGDIAGTPAMEQAYLMGQKA
jgi:multimeric flavodoxin WrbA